MGHLSTRTAEGYLRVLKSNYQLAHPLNVTLLKAGTTLGYDFPLALIVSLMLSGKSTNFNNLTIILLTKHRQTAANLWKIVAEGGFRFQKRHIN